MKVKQILCLAYILATSFTANADTKTSEEEWSSKLITYFEMFCYQTDAKLSKSVALAKVLKKSEMPKETLLALMPIDDVDKGVGYILEKDKENGRGMFTVTVENKDVCSVSGIDVDHKYIIDSMEKNYSLYKYHSTDIGLQINTMYIPGGVLGSIKEVNKKGIIAILRSKPRKEENMLTISFMPSRTAKRL